jgi:hypothetical protein
MQSSADAYFLEFQAMKTFALRTAARHATLRPKPNYLYSLRFSARNLHIEG